MEKSFKCCKNKLFSNYCCIECNSIFHPSCMDRCQQAIKLGGYKILCSLICQTNSNERDDGRAAFQQEIESLQQEIRDKDRYLDRLKRNSRVFEDEVSDAEKSFALQLERINQRNSTLEDEIKEVRSQAENLTVELKSAMDLNQILEEKMRELTTLNRNMVTTIATLENDNQAYLIEVKELKLNLLNIQEENNAKQMSNGADMEDLRKTSECMMTSIKVLESEKKVLESENKQYYSDIKTLHDKIDKLQSFSKTKTLETNCRHLNNNAGPGIPGSENIIIEIPQELKNHVEKSPARNILILGDQTVKNLDKPLRRYFEENVAIQTIVKPNASYKNVLDNLGSLVKNFTEDDVVIIGCGSNDLGSGKYPSIRYINNSIKSCLHTNVIFLSCPVLVKKFASRVTFFNSRLSSFVDYIDRYIENSISFLDICDKMGTKLKDFKLCYSLLSIINAAKRKTSNLIHIKCTSLNRGITPRGQDNLHENLGQEVGEPLNVTLPSTLGTTSVGDTTFLGVTPAN